MWGRKRVSLGWESGGILCERVLDRPSSNHRGPQTVIWKYLLHRKSFCPDYTEIQIWGTQTFRKGQEQCLSGVCVCVWGGCPIRSASVWMLRIHTILSLPRTPLRALARVW